MLRVDLVNKDATATLVDGQEFCSHRLCLSTQAASVAQSPDANQEHRNMNFYTPLVSITSRAGRIVMITLLSTTTTFSLVA
jgi:hypothetical protein